MVYRVLADAVVMVHLAFILFVAVGPLLAWRWPRMTWAHLPALAWGIGAVTIGFSCPLTILEKALDRRGGGDVYDGGFIDRYVEDVVYPGEYSSILRSLAAAVVVIGYMRLRRRRSVLSALNDLTGRRTRPERDTRTSTGGPAGPQCECAPG